MHLTAHQIISILAAMTAAGHAADLDDLACGTLVAVCLVEHAPHVVDERTCGGVRVVALDDLGARGTHRTIAARWASLLGLASSDVYVATVRG